MTSYTLNEACSQKLPQIQNDFGITENERPTENFIWFSREIHAYPWKLNQMELKDVFCKIWRNFEKISLKIGNSELKKKPITQCSKSQLISSKWDTGRLYKKLKKVPSDISFKNKNPNNSKMFPENARKMKKNSYLIRSPEQASDELCSKFFWVFWNLQIWFQVFPYCPRLFWH